MTDFHEQARRMVAKHRPEGIEGVDVFDFAKLAAELGWDVEQTVPVMAETYGIDDASAREMLLAERSERHGRELEDES